MWNLSVDIYGILTANTPFPDKPVRHLQKAEIWHFSHCRCAINSGRPRLHALCAPWGEEKGKAHWCLINKTTADPSRSKQWETGPYWGLMSHLGPRAPHSSGTEWGVTSEWTTYCCPHSPYVTPKNSTLHAPLKTSHMQVLLRKKRCMSCSPSPQGPTGMFEPTKVSLLSFQNNSYHKESGALLEALRE